MEKEEEIKSILYKLLLQNEYVIYIYLWNNCE